MGKGKRLRKMRAANAVIVQRNGNRMFLQSQLMRQHDVDVQKAIGGISERWFYTIRLIAIVTMFIDHLGKVLYLTRCINANWYISCYVIGRIAFPLFVFELVESFYVTTNRKKHLLRLGLLALVSELPYDMVASLPDPTEFSEYAMQKQNVCFTLFLGLLMLMIADKLDSKIVSLLHKHRYIVYTLSLVVKVILAVVFGFIASILMTDYSWYGIVLIALFSFARSKVGRWAEHPNAYTMFWQGVAMLWFAASYGVSPIVFIPLSVSLVLIYTAQIQSEHEQGGKRLSANTISVTKWVCRVFYPAHLALLGTLRALLAGWTVWK